MTYYIVIGIPHINIVFTTESTTTPVTFTTESQTTATTPTVSTVSTVTKTPTTATTGAFVITVGHYIISGHRYKNTIILFRYTVVILLQVLYYNST